MWKASPLRNIVPTCLRYAKSEYIMCISMYLSCTGRQIICICCNPLFGPHLTQHIGLNMRAWFWYPTLGCLVLPKVDQRVHVYIIIRILWKVEARFPMVTIDISFWGINLKCNTYFNWNDNTNVTVLPLWMTLRYCNDKNIMKSQVFTTSNWLHKTVYIINCNQCTIFSFSMLASKDEMDALKEILE